MYITLQHVLTYVNNWMTAEKSKTMSKNSLDDESSKGFSTPKQTRCYISRTTHLLSGLLYYCVAAVAVYRKVGREMSRRKSSLTSGVRWGHPATHVFIPTIITVAGGQHSKMETVLYKLAVPFIYERSRHNVCKEFCTINFTHNHQIDWINE